MFESNRFGLVCPLEFLGRVTVALTFPFFFFLRRVYKAARVTRVGGLTFLTCKHSM